MPQGWGGAALKVEAHKCGLLIQMQWNTKQFNKYRYHWNWRMCQSRSNALPPPEQQMVNYGGCMKLNDLSPSALKAAMQGGTSAWGQWGSSSVHIRYAVEVESKSRRRCHCGCKKRATYRGMANGICLIVGCEFSIRKWVKG